MKSSELSKYGFGAWFLFSRKNESALIAALPTMPAHALRCCREYMRRIGSSDILYFGCATNNQGLKNRLRQYFHPGPSQATNKRILAFVGDCADYELSFVVASSIPSAKMLEASLLEKYESDHGELPPQNKRR